MANCACILTLAILRTQRHTIIVRFRRDICRQADGAINCNGSATGHGKGAISRVCSRSTICCGRLFGNKGIGLIEGNQQRHASRYGVGAGRQGVILHEYDNTTATGRSGCIIQFHKDLIVSQIGIRIVKSATHHENAISKHSLDCHVLARREFELFFLSQ